MDNHDRRDAVDNLVQIMAKLRSEDGCPWDREQDHKSLKRYLLEETYEVLDAIDREDDDALLEELGDLLLQVVFHSQIAAEQGRFTLSDVAQGISRKLIRRHPHVFGDVHAPDAETVVANWERIKARERAAAPDAPSLLDGLPPHLPALMYAEKAQERTARVGFEWDDVSGALEKIAEEAAEVIHAQDDPEALEEEWGDLLFAMVNAARYMKINSEEALRKATRKFVARFRGVEEAAAQSGRDLASMSLEEMDRLWEEAKQKERQG